MSSTTATANLLWKTCWCLTPGAMAYVICADAIFMFAGTKDDKVTVKTDKEVDFAKISIEDAFKELKVLLRLQNVLEPLSIFRSSL